MNPFIPFRPAFGTEFVNRKLEIETIANRIHKQCNTAIVGEPHIGKTSLLKRLSEPTAFSQLVTQAENYILVDIDCQLFGELDGPKDFWSELIRQVVAYGNDLTVDLFGTLQEKVNERLNKHELNAAFTALGRTHHCVVVFIDEFDSLFNLDAFQTLDFFGALRSIAMKSRGLVVVTASRLSVTQMNILGNEYNIATRGSGIFNYLDELPLGTFDHPIVESWLGDHFPQEAIDEACLIAGHHPLLLQIAGDLLFDMHAKELQLTLSRELRDSFLARADQQFNDLWQYLTAKAQIALVIFVLMDLQGEAGGSSFNLGKAEKYLTWYQQEIKDMTRRGTLEFDQQNGYHIGSKILRAWITERKIVGTRGDEPGEEFTSWLHDNEFKLGGLITNEEISFLHKTWKQIPVEWFAIAQKVLLPAIV